MHSVRRLSTALAILVTGAATLGAQAADVSRTWYVNTLGTASEAARQEFLQGLRDADGERFIDARNHFNAAVAADPNFAIGHLFAAFNSPSIATYKNHLDEAVRLVDKASPAEQLWIRAEQKGADNDVNGQIALAEQLVQLTPTDPRAYGYLAGAQFAANKRAEARATLEKVTTIEPTYVQGWIQLGNNYLVTEPRDVDKAEAYILKAAALAQNEAVVHDYMGDVYRAENKLPQARAEYTRMAELAPTRGEGFQQRGHVNSFLGNFAEARADYDRAIALSDPTLKPSYGVFRSLVSVYEGNPKAAEQELDRVASTIDPSLANATGLKIFALTEEARIAMHNGQLDVAQRTIDQLKPLFIEQAKAGKTDAFRRGTEANAVYWEGMLAARKGDFAGAREKAQQYMKLLEPDQNPRKNEAAHEMLAMADYLQGNFASAASHFAEANPDDNYIWYYRGLALEKAGKTAEAKEFFKRAAQWNFNGSGTALTKKEAGKKTS